MQEGENNKLEKNEDIFVSMVLNIIVFHRSCWWFSNYCDRWAWLVDSKRLLISLRTDDVISTVDEAHAFILKSYVGF